MRRLLLLITTLALGMVLAGGLALTLGSGNEPSVAQAQPQGRENDARTQGAPGQADGRGVALSPEESRRQAAPGDLSRVVETPPPGLTDQGKAAIKQARAGNAQPAGRPTIDVGAIPSGTSTNGPETSEPQPDAPAFGTSFLGVADTGSFPPDSQIAAGPNNIVASTNGAVNILDKRGNSLSSQTLRGFFSPLGAEHNDVFDPWLAYDPYLNRFWIMAVSGRTTARNDMVIGLSNTQDATLGWTLWELDATVDGATDTQNWCDYPKLGFDAQAIYVTCNMFRLNTTTNANEFQYTKTRIMTKNQFVNNTGIFWWDFWDLREGNTGSTALFTLQPAQMFGAGVSDGEFLVNARGRGGTGSTLDVWRVTNAAECCNGDGVGPNLAHSSRGVNTYGPSDGARQPGSTTQINNGDSRLLYAFWKNGRLSTGHTLACSGTPTNACGGFTELNVSGYPTISTDRNYALTAGGQDVYYPSMSVNGADDRTMVFTVSDSSLSPTAAYLGVPSITDCPGNPTCFDGGTTAFRGGQNSNGYVRLDGSGRNRWGDYSGASPDPNGEGIWVAGEFAAAADDTWGVQAGLTYQTAPPPANDAFASAQFISGQNVAVGGTNRYATWQPGEPGSGGTHHSVWYRWTAPFSGPVNMDTCTNNFDTVLAVYTGGSLGGLSQVASNDDACAPGSQLAFNALAGTTYRIAVRGFSGAEGTFTLDLDLADVTAPRVSTTSPANDATGVGRGTNVTATFSEAMNAATINGTTFKLFRAGSTSKVGAAVTYNATSARATLNPNNSLQAGTRYKATVTTGAKDLAGNSLDQKQGTAGNQSKVWFFRTTN